MSQVVCDMMLELADQCHLSIFSETQSLEAFQYAITQVKDKLLEDNMFVWVFGIVLVEKNCCGARKN